MSMRYTERYRRQTVDQWSRCYLNYSHLKLLNNLLRDSVRQAINLNDLLKFGIQNKSQTQQHQHQFMYRKYQIPDDQRLNMQQYRDHFQKFAQEANEMFIETYTKNIQLYEQFTSFKYQEIKDNFHMCWTFYYLSGPQDAKLRTNQFAHYLQYLHVQAHFLSRMIRSNIQAQRRILQKHKLYSNNVFQTPQPCIGTYLKVDDCNKLRKQIQNYYIRINKKTVMKSRQRITQLAQQVNFSYIQSLIIGLLVGGIITIIIFMCIILARAGVALEIDPIFNQYFPLWRGISFYIFYVWMIGVCIFYFQRYKISHKIILENKFIRYPKSTDLFKIAGFFSILFIVCFILYALELADLLETYQMSPQFLPLFVWVPFILFLINPFPILYWQGRLYVFKMLGKIIGSIIFPVDFLAVVATTQLFALINAVQDTVYAICYYTHMNLPFPQQQYAQQNVCKLPATQAKFWFTISLYSLRLFHCMRGVYINWGKQPFYKMLDFLNTIKFSFGLGTTILSYLWRQANNASIFPAWLVFAIITAGYSFVWDMRVSFDLVNLNSKNFLLRNQIIFKKRNYYLWIILTLILRCTWALYISPNIVRNFLGSPQIFLLVLGYLQIIRRGIWNTIRVQIDQVRNRQVFRAVPKQKQTAQDKLYTFVKEHKEKLNCISVQSILESGTKICDSQLQKRQTNKNRKTAIVEDAKMQFEEQQSQRLVAQQYNKINKKLIKQLLENVY